MYPFTQVRISQDDVDLIKGLAVRYPDCETGGDLFGSWRAGGTEAVVRLVLGPGAKARGYATSFFQDKDFLLHAGGIAVNELNLLQVSPSPPLPPSPVSYALLG